MREIKKMNDILKKNDYRESNKKWAKEIIQFPQRSKQQRIYPNFINLIKQLATMLLRIVTKG